MLSLLVIVALAQTPEPSAVRAEAKRLFVQGEKSFSGGDLAAAEASFRKSFALLPLPATAFNLARCAQQSNAPGNAIGWYRRYLRLPPTPPDRPAVEATINTLGKRLSARGVQALTLFLGPAQAVARVDEGEPLGDGATVELAPGSHHLVVTAAGFVTNQFDLNISLSGPIELSVTLEPTPATPPPMLVRDAPKEDVKPVSLAPKPAAEPAPVSLLNVKTEPRPHRFRVTWVGVGLTAAAALTWLVSGLVASSSSAQLVDGSVREKTEVNGLYRAASTAGPIANVSWVMTSVFAAGTAVAFGVEW